MNIKSFPLIQKNVCAFDNRFAFILDIQQRFLDNTKFKMLISTTNNRSPRVMQDIVKFYYQIKVISIRYEKQQVFYNNIVIENHAV